MSALYSRSSSPVAGKLIGETMVLLSIYSTDSGGRINIARPKEAAKNGIVDAPTAKPKIGKV
ncbi:MAG: hypothetical protein QXV57_07205 [Thermoproteota archaeon]